MAEPKVATTIYLSPEVSDALREYVYQKRTTRRDVVEAALRKYLPAALLKGAKP